jgi:hypothetical protein
VEDYQYNEIITLLNQLLNLLKEMDKMSRKVSYKLTGSE